ncbi:sulfotransferase 6B1-like [Discoglossus pictus]
MLSLEQFAKHYDAAKHIPDDELLFDYNGVLYLHGLCCKETFQVMNTLEARKDDVLLASYPKSGTIWTFQILSDMIYTVNNKPKVDYLPLIECGSPEHFEDINKMPSPRFLSTHLQADNVPKSIFKVKPQILVVIRNPKDTAVSCYHFYQKNPMLPTMKSWDEFFPYFLNGKVFWGSYFDYAVGWNKYADDDNVLIITYEEMKKDLVSAVRKISKHYGFALTDEQVHFVADKCTFKNMKEKSEDYREFGQALFRKGDVGDWKKHFSEAQSKEMDAKFEKLLAGTKVGEKINYNLYCKW